MLRYVTSFTFAAREALRFVIASKRSSIWQEQDGLPIWMNSRGLVVMTTERNSFVT
jgi:hypothetical protein